MDYYFDPAVASGGSGTQPDPWPISKVPTTGVANDRLLFKIDGIYTGVITYTRSGSAGNPIIFDLYGSGIHNPIFDGGGSGSPTFQFTGCNYITLNNLVGRNTTSQYGPWSFNSCTNITLNNIATIESTTGVKNIRGMNFLNCGANLTLNKCWFHGFSDNATHTHGGGSAVQFNNCNGGGIIVTNCKVQVEVTPGTSGMTDGVGDEISIYQCYGTSSNWSLITLNQQRGGSSHTAGYAANVIGDVGGSYQKYQYNTIVNTGKVLLQVQGGTFMDMSFNNCFGDYFPYNSVGMAFGNYSGAACNNVTMQGNRIRFKRTATTYYNKWWDPAAKTFPAFQPAGWTSNTGDSVNDSTSTPVLDDTLLPNPLFRIIDYPWDVGGSSPVSLAFLAIPTKVYGTADFSPGATSSNPITYSSSDISIATIVSGKIHIVKTGSCTITANDGTTSLTQNLTVNKAVLAVSADNKTKVYGSANPALTATITGFVLGETSAVLTSQPVPTTGALTSSVVGSYPITVSGGTATNYSFTYTSGSLVVTKASLTITADSKTKAYGAAVPSLTVSYSGFVNGDTSASLSNAPTPVTSGTNASNAGAYPITVSGAVATNYTITYISGVLTITPVGLTLTADNKTKSQGAANPTLTISYSGFVNGDDSSDLTTQPAIATTAVTGSPVGTYPITITGGSSSNYTISRVAGTLTVSAASITFPDLPSKVYGDGDFAPGATSSLAITYSSDNTAIATIVAGNIHIVAAGSCNIIANNGSTTVSKPLTVIKKGLTVTADNYVIPFGGAIPSPLTMSLAGFITGEDIANLTTAPTASTTATMGSPAGSYPTTPSGGVSGNYAFTYVPGTLAISAGGTIVIHYPIIQLT
jgi:hypothetical protein